MDLWDPDVFEAGFPHAEFERLRATDPVHWVEEPDGPGFWAVTRHEHVREVSRHPDVFSSFARGPFIEEHPPEALDQLRLMMLTMDPPEHTQLRLLVNKGFTPRMIGALEPHVHELTRAVLDGLPDDGSFDFVSECAAELPLLVIAELLGVPVEDRARLFDWSNRLIGLDDPDYRTSAADAEVATMELFAYATAMTAERRADSVARDDLVSVLMRAEVDGESLTQLEIDLFFMLLVVAGNETTRNMISHSLLALTQHPDQWERLVADRSLLPTAVEEFLRWSPPVMQFRRTATVDTLLGDQKIAVGDKVIVYYPSANRDEAVFEEPMRFDVGRIPNEHLAFGGGGPHFCLGANLARLEIRVMFEELLDRYSSVELAGEPRLLRSNFINGIKSLPVRLS